MMKRIKTVLLIAAASLYIIGVGGCKPTEKNYKAAYEAADAKRRADLEQRGLGNMTLQNDLNISKRPVGEKGDSIWICHDLLTLEADEISGLSEGRYGVAVAMFRMPANANAMSEDLRSRGMKAAVGKSGNGKWFVLSNIFTTLNDAAAGIQAFERENPDFLYVGLPAPAIVNIRR
ncbi:MAG: SPOR domain-containing protein [Muribaculum sp.]|nr:SPOR domain-containing protein [Muribaculum sp.]